MKNAESIKPQLEPAWEAVQDIYTTYANIVAYKGGIQSFCSFGEKTYLMRISRNHIQSYYDKNEAESSAENGLKDFINPRWIRIFLRKSGRALNTAKKFTERYHLKGKNPEKKELFTMIKQGTKVYNDLFVVFEALQPQYSAKFNDYIKGRLPKNLTNEEKEDIILTLSLSTEKTFLLTEEISWGKLVKRLRKRFGKGLPTLEEYGFKELEKHAADYGMIGAVDSHPPWSKQDLYKRLLKDYSDRDVVNAEDRWKKQRLGISWKKKKIIGLYKPSAEVVRHCRNISLLGNIRLKLRIEGWMPMAYMLTHGLLLKLEKYVPYTYSQLTSCRHDELFRILDGDYSLSREELDSRFNLILYGLLCGEEVLWHGKEAERMIKKYLPPINADITELRGQIAMKGFVKAECYLIHWDSEDLAGEIEAMPDGAVLVVGQTRPQLMPAIKKASAIISDEGGFLSHAAIVSRELGKPCIMGTIIATKVLKNGMVVEVDATNGIIKKVK